MSTLYSARRPLPLSSTTSFWAATPFASFCVEARPCVASAVPSANVNVALTVHLPVAWPPSCSHVNSALLFWQKVFNTEIGF